MSKIAKRAFISGVVQGVYFRANTQQQATKLGITGWVRNLADGRVEVFACGTPEKLEQLIAWLHQGPSAATVDNVTIEDAELEQHNEFLVV